MKKQFPESKSDLFAAFIERCTQFAKPGGAAALITMQSWMFLSSYQKLRSSLLTHQHIASMLHLGTRAFESIGGEVVSSTAFVLTNLPTGTHASERKREGAFIRLVDGTSEAEKTAGLAKALYARTKDAGFYWSSSEDFSAVPGSPIAYWLSENMLHAFVIGRSLSEVGSAKAGISTGNNARFQRFWFEASQRDTAPVGDSSLSGPYKWFPCRSGGDFRRWYGNAETLVNWQSHGESIRAWRGSAVRNMEFQGLSALTYSKISSGDFSLRSSEAGFLFDDTGRSLITDSDNAKTVLLSVLNSNVGKAALSALAPTLTFTSGEIEKVPVHKSSAGGTTKRVLRLVDESARDWHSSELSWDFEVNPLVALSDGRDTR